MLVSNCNIRQQHIDEVLHVTATTCNCCSYCAAPELYLKDDPNSEKYRSRLSVICVFCSHLLLRVQFHVLLHGSDAAGANSCSLCLLSPLIVQMVLGLGLSYTCWKADQPQNCCERLKRICSFSSSMISDENLECVHLYLSTWT